MSCLNMAIPEYGHTNVCKQVSNIKNNHNTLTLHNISRDILEQHVKKFQKHRSFATYLQQGLSSFCFLAKTVKLMISLW